ncbi:MAG: dienelactone hydrolase family protein [Ekhidna sp.]|nr:dienelactone hydrolase family protein [Ekhidna sp.]
MKRITYASLAVLFIVACSTSTKEGRSITEAEQPATVEKDIVGKPVSYIADSINMNGYIVEDINDKTKKPGIIVVHEWWGHNDYSRERAAMLAELGYVALAVDMYGDGRQAAHPNEAGEFASMVMGNLEVAKARFGAALETLKNYPNVDPEKIGAIGYCFGGSVVLSMANAGYDLDAIASFHGGLGLPVMPEPGSVKGKVLVANGADDTFIPAQQINDFKAAMDAAGVDYKFINYEGALHSFTSREADELAEKFGMRIAYNAAADSASWKEMKMLFSEAFK